MESEETSAKGGEGFRDYPSFSFEAAGQEFSFHPSGAGRLEALIELIGAAERSLKLFYYVFADDPCGTRIRDSLCDAAERGVEVTLIVDDFGSTGDAFFACLVDAGGTLRRFSARRGARYLIRNHQKMTIADDEAAMIGGFNIEQAYFDPAEVNGWNDLGVIVRGDAVPRLSSWFALLFRWSSAEHASLREARREVREWDPGSGAARWLVGGPSQRLSPWAKSVNNDIACATRLDIMVAYFSPRRGLVRRIGAVAERVRKKGGGEGAGARLLLAAKSDNGATIGAARANYGRMLRRGVTIHEFEPCKLHTKLYVIDDAVYFGSANFDMRSLYLNLEIMLRIEDAALAERMRDYIAWHARASTEITRELHRHRRTVWNRIRWSLSWFLVTVVDYTVTRRLNLGLASDRVVD